MPSLGNLGSTVVPMYGGGQVRNPANVLVLTAAPSANATGNPVGTIAVNRSTGIAYMAVANTGLNGTVTWAVLGGATAAVATINSNAPVAGNYVLAGTANQITATQTAGTTTFSIPAIFSAPGTVVSATGITATAGGVTATAGDIVATAGNISTTAGSITSATTLTATLGNITATNGDFVSVAADNGFVAVATTVAGASPVVNNVRHGRASFTDVINAAAVGALVCTNSLVSAASIIIAQASCATVGSAVVIRDYVPGAGTVTFNVTNLGGTNTGANIFIDFWVVN